MGKFFFCCICASTEGPLHAFRYFCWTYGCIFQSIFAVLSCPPDAFVAPELQFWVIASV